MVGHITTTVKSYISQIECLCSSSSSRIVYIYMGKLAKTLKSFKRCLKVPAKMNFFILFSSKKGQKREKRGQIVRF